MAPGDSDFRGRGRRRRPDGPTHVNRTPMMSAEIAKLQFAALSGDLREKSLRQCPYSGCSPLSYSAAPRFNYRINLVRHVNHFTMNLIKLLRWLGTALSLSWSLISSSVTDMSSTPLAISLSFSRRHVSPVCRWKDRTARPVGDATRPCQGSETL